MYVKQAGCYRYWSNRVGTTGRTATGWAIERGQNAPRGPAQRRRGKAKIKRTFTGMLSPNARTANARPDSMISPSRMCCIQCLKLLRRERQ